jgi:hypothetical protein
VRLHTLSVLLGLSPVILLVWLAVFFSRLQASSNKQDPRQDGGALEFFLAPGMRILLSLVQFALLAFSVALVVFAPAESSLYAALFPLSVLVVILLAKPRAVILDHNGIRQRRWIRNDREIAWNDRAWVRRGQNTSTTYVKSKEGGRPISFSPLLVGQSRFEPEVRKQFKGFDDEE